jgi:hypothetical protein
MQNLKVAWGQLSEEKKRAWLRGWEPAFKDEPFTLEERQRAFERVERLVRSITNET